MLSKAAAMVACLFFLSFPAADATTISLPGSYELSPDDMVVLTSAAPDRTLTYNLEVLVGNQIDFSVRFGNLNAMNEEFGDIVTGGAFGVYHNDDLLIAEDGILDCVFGEIEIPVSELVDEDGRLRLRLQLVEESDPLAFYRPWLYITDDVAPAATEDLIVTRSFETALKLEWTAPGDDGMEGIAAMYEIRYSKWPVEDIEEWWDFAEQAADLPYPDEPGSPQSVIIGDLDTVSTYHFILVTYDEMANRSGFSNVASGATGEDGGGPSGPNYCLEYNGQNTRAVVPFNENLNPPENITLEAWVYPHSLAGETQKIVFDKPWYYWEYPFYHYNLAINEEGTMFSCVLAGGDVHCLVGGAYGVLLNEWTHLALTYDGTAVRNFVNARINKVSNVQGLITGVETDLSIGIRGAVDYGFFNGLIDEIRIWDVARTQEQIEETMHLPLTGNEPGLIAYWNFDEGEGQWFYDITGYGSNGYLGYGPEGEEIDPIWVESDCPIDYRRTENSDETNATVPQSYQVSQNYPNPFNAETKIFFALPEASFVKLEIYDMLGRHVTTLADAHFDAGIHEIGWDGRSDSGQALSSGIYFYRLKTDSFDQSKKMLMLK